MSNVEEARRKTFKLWVEYGNKANELEDRVFKLELAMNKAYAGIKVDTEMYQSYEFLGNCGSTGIMNISEKLIIM